MPILITDPIVLATDANGDVDRSTGGSRFASGPAAVVQGIRDRCELIRGEWFLDLDVGIPYFERDGVPASAAIVAQKFDETRARVAYRAAILRAPGVLEVTKLLIDFNPTTRVMSVAFAVTTTFGDTVADTLSRGI